MLMRQSNQSIKTVPYPKHNIRNSKEVFNDKLIIVTYKNAIYQSKLKLLAIFVTILVCKQHNRMPM
jgi:hypothetical protein